MLRCYEDAVVGYILARLGPNKYEAALSEDDDGRPHFIVNTKQTKFDRTGYFQMCVATGNAKKVKIPTKNGFVQQWWSYTEDTRKRSVKWGYQGP